MFLASLASPPAASFPRNSGNCLTKCKGLKYSDFSYFLGDQIIYYLRFKLFMYFWLVSVHQILKNVLTSVESFITLTKEVSGAVATLTGFISCLFYFVASP